MAAYHPQATTRLEMANLLGRHPACRLRRGVALAIGALLPLLAIAGAGAGSLDDIRARGTLVVGVKADYRPFGFRDGSGAVVGFEPDLAAELARTLGVSPKLVPVVAMTRVTLLDSGEIDLVIATMNETPERRKQVDFVEPSYYASCVNVLARKTARLHNWQQLRGKPVCTVEGAYYVSEIEQRYNPDLRLFKDTNQLYAAVKSGECMAAYDDTALIGQLQTPEWQDYEMPLRSILPQPWGMAVSRGNTELARFVGGVVRNWHATGYIETLEKRWRIPPSIYAEEMRRRFADSD